MVEMIKMLSIRFGACEVTTGMDEHGDRWVTVPTMLEALGIAEFQTDYPVKYRLVLGAVLPVIPVVMIGTLIRTKRATALQSKLEAEWLHFLGFIKGPKGEGASRKANRESLHLLKKAVKLVAILQSQHGYEPVDTTKFLQDTLYGEMLGIMGYHQQVDWEDLSLWELQNLTFVQNVYTSAVLLYLSQEEIHQEIQPDVCLTVLLTNIKYDLSKTMNSMFMAQELAIKLGKVLEFESNY